jgi:hypothetical protein
MCPTITGVMPLPAVTNSSRGQRVRQHVLAARRSQPHDRSARHAPHQVRRDETAWNHLHGDRDPPVSTLRDRGQRVGAPVAHAVDRDADADVLARPMRDPVQPGPDPHRRAVGGLGQHRLHPPTRRPRRPQRIHVTQIVVGQQRSRQPPRPAHEPPPSRGRQDVHAQVHRPRPDLGRTRRRAHAPSDDATAEDGAPPFTTACTPCASPALVCAGRTGGPSTALPRTTFR